MKRFFVVFVLTIVGFVEGDFFDPQCQSFGVSCLDCFTQKFCVGGVLWSNNSCDGGIPNNPRIYCNPSNSQCTSEPPPGCAARGLSCLRANGTFPELSNCSRYVECRNGNAAVKDCPKRSVYSAKLAKCLPQLEESDCAQPKCGLGNTVAAYPGDSTLYLQCLNGAGKLLSCPDGSVYNATSNRCTSMCTSTASQANYKNCSEYTTCQGLQPLKKSCQSGYGFNRLTNECEKGLNRLCYEITSFRVALLDSSLPEAVKGSVTLLREFLRNYVNLDTEYLLRSGLPEDVLSEGLLVGSYVLRKQSLPPQLVKQIMQFAIGLLPDNLKIPIELLLPIVIGNIQT